MPEKAPPQNMSSVEPYRAVVEKLIKEKMEVAAVHERLKERGYVGSYSAVYRFVGWVRGRLPEATVRVECAPEEEGQVDFGYAGRMIDPETDKTHLAEALAQAACRQGFGVLFLNAYTILAQGKLLQHLHGGRADNSWERRFKSYLRPDLLILDDFGLKPLQGPGPSDLYDLIDERYEQGSILLTGNRPPAEWPGLFGEPLLASAGIDRLCHRAEIVIIRGQSFRAQSRRLLEQEQFTSPEAVNGGYDG